MNTVLTILGAIFLVLLFVIFAAVCIMGVNIFIFFHRHKCKHCNHTMDYRGLKEDDSNGHYLFHCPKCGAWESVPKEEFFRQCDNSTDETK